MSEGSGDWGRLGLLAVLIALPRPALTALRGLSRIGAYQASYQGDKHEATATGDRAGLRLRQFVRGGQGA